jgi:hypothetical protein
MAALLSYPAIRERLLGKLGATMYGSVRFQELVWRQVMACGGPRASCVRLASVLRSAPHFGSKNSWCPMFPGGLIRTAIDRPAKMGHCDVFQTA